ncbi:unnamed protein product, partial [Ascophyllum nodosum]
IWKRNHPRSFAAAGRHVDGREWNRRSGWSIGGKRRRHRPSPPPAASSAERGDVGVLRDHPDRREGIGGTTLPPLSPVAPSTGGDTSGLQSQSEERRKSDRLDITAQQDNPRSKSRRHTVTPAVTRSAARAQLG